MDHSRKRHPRRKLGAVDGMLPAQPRQLRPKPPAAASSSSVSSGSQLGGGRKRLDNFAVREGFHPSRQPKINTPGVAEQPHGHGRHEHADASEQNEIDKVFAHETIDLSLDEGAKKPKRNIIQIIKGWPRKKYLAIPAAIVLIFGFLFIKGIWKLNQVFQGGGGAVALQEDIDPSQLKGEGDGRVNILMLGRGGDGHAAPDLTDTILVASIDPINHQAALLSIPRDLWVQPEGSGYTKINAVYANAKYSAQYSGQSNEDAEKAGLAAIEKVVSDKMGIPIHYHAIVDFKAFKQAINAVGGIDINVKPENTVYEYLWDPSAGEHYTLDVGEGSQHFDGRRALFYARSRQTSPRGDFDRTERQRLVLVALKEKVLSAGTFSNPAKISGLLDAFGNHVRINMTTSEMLRLYEIGSQIDSNNIASIGLADPPNNYVTTGMVSGQSVVMPRAGIDDFSEIQSYVRNALRDGFLASEDAKILILNGTKVAGLAGNKSDELKSYGYNVIGVGTARTQAYNDTILVDLSNGQKKYSRHYLQTRLGVTAVSSLPDNTINTKGADFVIILGADEASSR